MNNYDIFNRLGSRTGVIIILILKYYNNIKLR